MKINERQNSSEQEGKNKELTNRDTNSAKEMKYRAVHHFSEQEMSKNMRIMKWKVKHK